jgi:hypothetical protein
MNDGRTRPRSPAWEPRRAEPGDLNPAAPKFGGDGKITKTSAFVAPEPDLEAQARLSRAPGEHTHHDFLTRHWIVHPKPTREETDWGTQLYRVERDAQEDGKVAFPPIPVGDGPAHDHLGRPTGRRRGGLRS